VTQVERCGTYLCFLACMHLACCLKPKGWVVYARMAPFSVPLFFEKTVEV
jgi:hypothetical protein